MLRVLGDALLLVIAALPAAAALALWHRARNARQRWLVGGLGTGLVLWSLILILGGLVLERPERLTVGELGSFLLATLTMVFVLVLAYAGNAAGCLLAVHVFGGGRAAGRTVVAVGVGFWLAFLHVWLFAPAVEIVNGACLWPYHEASTTSARCEVLD